MDGLNLDTIEGAITYYKKLYIQGIKRQILNIIKVTEEYFPQEEIDKINKEIQKENKKLLKC